eukprot:5390481-Lingulodinium_polyedra.AAC.1
MRIFALRQNNGNWLLGLIGVSDKDDENYDLDRDIAFLGGLILVEELGARRLTRDGILEAIES